MLVLLSFTHRKRKKKNLEIKNKVNELYILSQTIEDQKNNIETLAKQINQKDKLQEKLNDAVYNLFKERWGTINVLCQRLYNADCPKNDSKVIQSLEGEIKKLCSPQSFIAIEETVNLYTDNIISRLRNQCSFLKSDEITILTLIIAGLTARTICMLTGIDYKYFYVKKNRIYNKIKESNVPDKASFESFLI